MNGLSFTQSTGDTGFDTVVATPQDVQIAAVLGDATNQRHILVGTDFPAGRCLARHWLET
jgi:hypothetical protein